MGWWEGPGMQLGGQVDRRGAGRASRTEGQVKEALLRPAWRAVGRYSLCRGCGFQRWVQLPCGPQKGAEGYPRSWGLHLLTPAGGPVAPWMEAMRSASVGTRWVGKRGWGSEEGEERHPSLITHPWVRPRTPVKWSKNKSTSPTSWRLNKRDVTCACSRAAVMMHLTREV